MPSVLRSPKKDILHPLGNRLWGIMEEKKTNLCVAADVTSMKELLHLAKSVGPHVCVLKTHIDILEDFSYEKVQELRHIAKEENFLLFEDRKFADIGNTAWLQYTKGIYRISEWTDLINAHALPGPGLIEGLAKGASKEQGLLLLAHLSSQGSFAEASYEHFTKELAEKYPEFVLGFISQKRIETSSFLFHFTPGVKWTRGEDTLKQNYQTIEYALEKKGADIIIVGRDIIHDLDPAARSKAYQEKAWRVRSELV